MRRALERLPSRTARAGWLRPGVTLAALAVAGLIATLAVAPPAAARVHVGIGFGVPLFYPPPVVYAPSPYYYYPPPPVVYSPPPAYYPPPPGYGYPPPPPYATAAPAGAPPAPPRQDSGANHTNPRSSSTAGRSKLREPPAFSLTEPGASPDEFCLSR